MQQARFIAALVASIGLLAAAPRHVMTADYWGGYSGTHNLPAQEAARWLSLAEVDPADSGMMSGLGVKTMLYTNPNREMPGDPMFTNEEDEFAHTCSGQRVRGESQYAARGLVLTNPGGRAMKRIWQRSVETHSENGHYDFIFADEASANAYALDEPCNFSFDSWLRDENSLFASLGQPVIYNGLNDFYNRGIAREIALNKTAAGGMMEECYAKLGGDHRVGDWMWWTTEATELRMAQARKYFICYGRDLTPADQAYDGRMYAYASFLLSYDPRTTILWEYYKTPSGGHVMPESQIVAWNPEKRVSRVVDLREAGGAYVRRYRDCYIAGRRVGPCAAAVNPDGTAHDVNLSGYHRVVQLRGSGIWDGGSIALVGGVPSSLQPLTAVIAFK